MEMIVHTAAGNTQQSIDSKECVNGKTTATFNEETQRKKNRTYQYNAVLNIEKISFGISTSTTLALECCLFFFCILAAKRAFHLNVWHRKQSSVWYDENHAVSKTKANAFFPSLL